MAEISLNVEEKINQEGDSLQNSVVNISELTLPNFSFSIDDNAVLILSGPGPKHASHLNNTGEICEPEHDDDKKLQALLEEFGLICLLPQLKDCGITYRSLKYLSKEDIAEVIPNVALRAEFREKLFLWKKQTFNIDAETLSADSKISNWLKEHYTNTCSSSSLISLVHCEV